MSPLIFATILGCSSKDNSATDTIIADEASSQDTALFEDTDTEDTNTEDTSGNTNEYNEALSIQDNLDANVSILDILEYNEVSELYGLFYEGGYIFYVNQESGFGMVAHSLETNEAVHWCDFEIQELCSGIGLLDESLGSGSSNTALITTALGEGSYAANVAGEASINGFDDWHLPSLNELSAVYDNLRLSDLGNADPTLSYWTSTDDSTYAWAIYFVNGNTYTPSKYHPHHNVLPVRSFDP
jgi:hypothetical protein